MRKWFAESQVSTSCAHGTVVNSSLNSPITLNSFFLSVVVITPWRVERGLPVSFP